VSIIEDYSGRIEATNRVGNRLSIIIDKEIPLPIFAQVLK